MESISCPVDDTGLPFPSYLLRAGSASLSQHLPGVLLPSGASAPLMAKPCLGCPSTSPTLHATGLCCPQSWECSQKDPPACSWPERDLGDNTMCVIYSQLGTNYFKRRNYLVQESFGAVLGDMGIILIASASQGKELAQKLSREAHF